MLGHDHYIYRLRAACIPQPHLNRYQLAALDRELALIRAAASPEAHLEASGDLLGLARGAALDRAVNALDVARRYDDPWAAAAAGIEFVHAKQGANHVELLTAIQIGHQRAAIFKAQSAEIHAAFTRLFLNLLHVHTSNFELGPAYEEIESSFQIIRNSDPAFLPHTWLEQPRYRRRLPWHSGIIHDWLAPYWDDAINPPSIPVDPGFLFTPPSAPTELWPDAEPLDAIPDTTIAEMYLQRQQDWPDEFLAAFWHAAREKMRAARSPIAQYAVASDSEARFSIESTYNVLALSALLAPLRAVANHGWEQTEESGAGCRKANATVEALIGLTPEQVVDLPRVRHFLLHNMQPRFALAGEAGFDLVRHAALWQAL